MARLAAWASIATALLFAGCAAGESASTSSTDVVVTEETGALRGVVIDDAINSVPNAVVAIAELGLSTVSGADGSYVIADIAPGSYKVNATLDGYEAAETQVEIRAGEVTSVDLTVVPLPSDVAYHVVQNKKGRTACGTAWRTPIPRTQVPGLGNVTGSGGLAACGAAYGTPLSSLDSFVVIFELTSGNISSVAALALETHWIRTQTFGSGLTVLWENYQDLVAYTFTEEVRNFTEVEGPSPLIGIVDQATIWANMTHWDPPPNYCMPNSTCKFWARVFPFPSTFGSGSAVDLALYVDQPYDHYVTEFYRKTPPEGYTAIADA